MDLNYKMIYKLNAAGDVDGGDSGLDMLSSSPSEFENDGTKMYLVLQTTVLIEWESDGIFDKGG